MTWWQSIIIGVVEGLTEYLPVSSTGHILLTQRILGIPDDDAGKAFAVVIQAGAIFAVLGLYFSRWRGVIDGLLGKSPEGLVLLRNLLLAFLPAAVFGLIFDKRIEALLTGLWPTVTAWFVGGIAILAVAWFRRNAGPASKSSGKTISDITVRMALCIGLIQCLAMWPGTSRSLVVIVGGLLCGLHMMAAVEFSFLLGMITLTAASGYKALKFVKDPALLANYSIPVMIIGILAAWITAIISVKWMVGFLQRRGITPFGYYRIALAVIIGALLLTDVMSPKQTSPSQGETSGPAEVPHLAH